MNKRQTIKIATAYGMVRIRARIIAPGLAVHEINRGSLMAQEMVWGITHIPSGTRITSTSTQPKAVKIARVLATLRDWSGFKRGKFPKGSIREVIDAIASVV